MKKSSWTKRALLLVSIVVFLAVVATVLAAPVPGDGVPACLTGSISSDGTTATGTAVNTCDVAYEVSLIAFSDFSSGTQTVFDGPYTQIVAPGGTASFTVALDTCQTKVILYFDGNPLDAHKHIAREVYNADKGFCDQEPTATPTQVPPTPTATPHPPTPTPEPSGSGTGTPGYWKTHPEAWPVSEITIGGITYSRDAAITLIGTPERGDKSLTMFRDLVSARLNVLIGNNSSCVDGTIASADAWMGDHPAGSNVRGNSAAWTVGEPLATTLDNYNNGLLCAPHRD